MGLGLADPGALYYQPDLDVARAQCRGLWRREEPRERFPTRHCPRPHLGEQPRTSPRPWIWGFNFDIPIETAGKRGARIRQAAAQAESARQNLALAAWQIRSRVRASLLATIAAREANGILHHQEKELAENARLMGARSDSGRASPLNAVQAKCFPGAAAWPWKIPAPGG